MKKLLHAAPASLIAVLCAASACTVSVTNGPVDGSVFFDDGGPDSSSVTGDAGTADVSTTTDGGNDATTDGGIVCTVAPGAGACETCVDQSCCTQNIACTSEPANDAGNTDCEDIASCFNDCRQPPADSGVAPDTIANCITTCSAGHTAAGTQDFNALETCQQTSCATQCQ